MGIPPGSRGPGSDSSTTYRPNDPSLEHSDGLHSLVFAFTMIIVSEIGDKTFLVAALMAMRHPRLLVFSSAFCALIAMTILSAVLGHAVPTLIPKSLTKIMAAVLFLIFGAKLFKEGHEMSPDEGVGEEMREVEMELEEKEQEQLRMGRRRSSVTPHNLEAGRVGGRTKARGAHNRLPSPPESVSSSSSRGSSPHPRRSWNDLAVGISNLFSLLLSPAWVQTFAMTFLGEWGDRSQIATIAMAAGQDYWWVTIGAITGHAICTAAAVIGGRAIAGRVSMRVGMYYNFPHSFGDSMLIFRDSYLGWRSGVPYIRHHLHDRGHVLKVASGRLYVLLWVASVGGLVEFERRVKYHLLIK